MDRQTDRWTDDRFTVNRQQLTRTDKPQGIFGVPLNVSIKYANVAISLTNDHGESFIYGYVPIVIAKCGVFLKEKGAPPPSPLSLPLPSPSLPCLPLCPSFVRSPPAKQRLATDVEGIFRLNGSAKRIKDLQEIFDSPERYGKGLDWTGYTVHDAANVLRRYLNQLPEPIVPLDFYEQFRQPLRIYQGQSQGIVPATESEIYDHAKAVAAYQQLIRDLPPLNKQLLLYILDLLAVFASKSDQNRMTSANLSAIFQPGMLSHPQHYMSPDEYKLSQDVLIFLIENQDHFLFGMNGTAADEETVKAVESGGLPPRAPTTTTTPPATQSNMRRSVSSASGGADSFRKYGSLRRNVSVSSKTSRTSNTAPSPGTTSSLSGVHRSNTLPSKMAPRRATAAAATAPDHTKRASPNRTPPSSATNNNAIPNGAEEIIGTSGMVYVHSATHGPVPKRGTDSAAAAAAANTAEHPLRDVSPPSASPPPPVAGTPSKERKLSSLFSKSPPPNGDRQPNRLRKKRSPGSVCESAQSSSQSLQATTDNASRAAPLDGNHEAGITPKPPHSSSNDESVPQPRDASRSENGPSQTADHTLKPHGSRTPSMTSFTDHSDLDQPDETYRPEQRRSNRRSWMVPPSKRSSEHVGLGLTSSPPLEATNPSANQSTSSIGSWHQASRSSPSDLQQFVNDPANQPLSLDAEISNKNHITTTHGADSERRSLFGKFKAKVGLSRDSTRDGESSDRTRSPVTSDTEKSASSLALSPPPSKDQNHRPSPNDGSRTAATVATTRTTTTTTEEPAQSSVSPLPNSSLPDAIPEEPITPESPVAAAAVAPAEKGKEAATTATTTAAASEPAPAVEPLKELN